MGGCGWRYGGGVEGLCGGVEGLCGGVGGGMGGGM